MYQLVIVLQCISIAALFVESWIVFRNWKGALHSYLFLSCVATLLNNIGYYLELKAHTEEAYFTALCLSYLGRVWIPFALLLFICELVHVHLPKIAKLLLGLINAVVYLAVVTTYSTGLYYKNIQFGINAQFPDFIHDNGILHTLWTPVLAVYIVTGLVLLIRAREKEQDPVIKKQLFMVIVAILVQGGTVLVEMSKLLPLSEVYDLTMIGFPLGAVFMYIAIFRYNLLDTEALAKEFVIDRLSEGIIALDGQGRLRFCNRPALQLFPDIRTETDRVTAQLYNAVRDGEPIAVNDRIYTPTKDILSRKGIVYGTVFALIDETEHYQYMEELKEQKYLADQANKAKSAFLANMSHEIRTPINAVLGMDEMILRESEEENTLVYADNIQTAGTTLLGLINDILDFSKIEAGKMEIIPVDYHAASMLNDLVNMIEPRIQGKGLRLNVEVDPKLPGKLHGDEIRLKQIVTNILTNAVKYTEKGSVTFSVSFEKLSETAIGLKISVRDTGIGIKEEDIRKLFSAFERIEEERNRSIEGTGLGMNITKQLLAMMDSQLEVESVYGEGSVFSFTVAQDVVSWEETGDFAEALKKAKTAKKRYRESFTAPEGSVLVVDDTPMNLTVIQGLLKRTRLRVTTAEKGEEAIRLAKQQAFDVIFLDHRMPDMDGVETLTHLKDETPVGENHTPVICLTANAVSGAKEEYIAAGFTDYLTKPIESELLEEMLIRYLPEEKVRLTGDEEQENVDTSTKEDKVYGQLSKLTGVEVESGIKNCGSVDNYLEALETMSHSIRNTISVVEETKAAGDWENYTIKVHAVKSSMRIIGAMRISVMAEGLEAAGGAGDINRITKATPELLEQLRALADELEDMFEEKEDENLPPIDPAQLKEAYLCIKEFAASYDIDSIESVLDTLNGYHIPDEEKERMSQLKDAVMGLDWMEIEKCIGSI